MIYKIFLFIVILLFQVNCYSKTNQNKIFNQKYLYNYFSALISFNNQKDDKAINFFNSSKKVLEFNNKFLEQYVVSQVISGRVQLALRETQKIKNKTISSFFEVEMIKIVDAISKKNFKQAKKYLKNIKNTNNGNYEFIIYEVLSNYINLFLTKKISDTENFGKLSLVTKAFQNCYLDNDKTSELFENIIKTSEGDYSRYIFFYFEHLIKINELVKAKKLSNQINLLENNLIVAQSKKWIDSRNFEKFKQYFSCKNEKDLIAEFLFLISNIYSSQEEYEKSNFYLRLSNYLNPKFYFNLSLISDNYFLNGNYLFSKKVLKEFNSTDIVYSWYKNKRLAQIIEKKKDKNSSLKFIENQFNKIDDPSIKIIYDMANIYKNAKKYEISIDYYSKLLLNLNENSKEYAEILYRRGGSYERIKKFKNSEKDLLNSLKIRPDDPYVLNYLAYSWLERDIKINEAMFMLEKAYKKKSNDPYIIDSLGWGYYLIGEYISAEEYIRKAIQLMPNDPIVNDHYADILWKLGRKLQAKYFWENVLKSDETDESLKVKVNKKLLN